MLDIGRQLCLPSRQTCLSRFIKEPEHEHKNHAIHFTRTGIGPSKVAADPGRDPASFHVHSESIRYVRELACAPRRLYGAGCRLRKDATESRRTTSCPSRSECRECMPLLHGRSQHSVEALSERSSRNSRCGQVRITCLRSQTK